MFPKTASMQQIQKNYRKLFDEVIESQEPLVVLNNNKPEVVIIDIHQFEEIQAKAEKYELELAMKAIMTYKKEKKDGKLKVLKSIKDLIDED
ncbi:type II toxin-antitoxin system Phd/YefM family antitoxin [Candidatus Peregrinibacteria bacterium]|nr:type II toxin-antitoxin system Phd/YefM family antitoxin [Candidatus Peregrinibacteria bacterium]